MYKTRDLQHLERKRKDKWVCHWNYFSNQQIAIYYKSLSVGCFWSRLPWYYRSFINTSVNGASRRLSSGVSSAIRFLFLDWLASSSKIYSYTRMCFRTSSAFLVRSLLVWEIYLCWLISRSSLQSLTPLVLYNFI